ncbi:MAG: retroviral-like aspartic protease [Planctomycetes bacterium]|nr:retroviral-like aspartic protease [Planctomycetota bacterium]
MSRQEFPYDATYDPPAPVVEIEVKGQGDARRCKALVDPSASVSCIPETLLEAIQAPEGPEIRISSLLGETKSIRRRLVIVRLGGKQVLLYILPLSGKNIALLGRDFLNDCVVVLDGKAQKVSVED